MKESTLLEMQNKIKALTNVVQNLLSENLQKRFICRYIGNSKAYARL